jgi:hypothetical protein
MKEIQEERMKNLYQTAMIACLAFALSGFSSSAQVELDVTGDPGEVKFYYEDLHNFLKAFKMINEGSDLKETLKTEYLDKATPALKNYMEDGALGLEDFVNRYDQYKEAYATLPEAPDKLAAQEDSIRKALASMKKVLPNSMFLPIYYMVGISGGMFAEPSEVGIRMAMSRLGDPDHLNRLRLTVFHENVHVQQFLAMGPEEYFKIYGDEQSLLAVSIREGVAEYLTFLILGEYTKKEVYDYIKKDEKKLWERFESEMQNREFGDWLFSAPKDQNQPRDLGYVMGALIVESFYENAEDKKQALQDILGITDYEGFLEKSRYREKF